MTSVTLVGPGAIGCAVAGALVGRDDVDLTIGARTGFERLVVDGPPETVDHAVDVRTDPATITAHADVALLAAKVHQTSDAARWLTAVCGDQTTIAVLQNGIGHRERVAPMVGGSTVTPAIIFLPADRHEPGRVSMSLPASLCVAGRPAAGGSRSSSPARTSTSASKPISTRWPGQSSHRTAASVWSPR